MQNYGVPSRLLDWTESPFVALFFAIMSSQFNFDGDKLKFENAAAVWILDPVGWNRKALEHLSFDGGVLSTEDDQIKGYNPTCKFSGMTDLPIAIYGTHNSPRIVAQRGVFTIFGENKTPMEKIYDSKNFPKDCLVKLTLNKGILPKIRNSLLNYIYIKYKKC